jgi:hypothetical protein
MTCVAMMVVPLVVPNARTGSPAAMALAGAELVPFWYVVEGASLTVTFWPAGVEIVKPDVDTLPTVPDAPPAAGADRALEPPPPDAGPPAKPPLAAAGLLPEVALTIPYEPPATAMAVAPTTMALVSLRERTC